jgi:hypothetical protein
MGANKVRKLSGRNGGSRNPFQVAFVRHVLRAHKPETKGHHEGHQEDQHEGQH